MKLTKLKNNIVRGDTPLMQFPLTVNGAVCNLTGYQGTFTLTSSLNPTSSDVPICKVQVSGDATGILNFQLLNGVVGNDTSLLVPGTTYYFDVQLNNLAANPGRRIFTVIRGQVGVDADYSVVVA